MKDIKNEESIKFSDILCATFNEYEFSDILDASDKIFKEKAEEKAKAEAEAKEKAEAEAKAEAVNILNLNINQLTSLSIETGAVDLLNLTINQLTNLSFFEFTNLLISSSLPPNEESLKQWNSSLISNVGFRCKVENYQEAKIKYMIVRGAIIPAITVCSQPELQKYLNY
jgi:glutamate mutase epsilon subunit